MENDLAIFAITKKGSLKAADLRSKVGGDLYIPEKFRSEFLSSDGVAYFNMPAEELLRDLFPRYRKIIAFCALGAMVRLLAPLLKDKTKDPAVVALDETGKFAVSVLSGHVGGANDLAEEVAKAIDAIPVITTASDVSGVFAVDMLPKSFGWGVERARNMTRISAAVVNRERVGIVQTCGDMAWMEDESVPIPSHVSTYRSIREALMAGTEFLIFITDIKVTDRMLGPLWETTVVFRPKSLVVGVGCNKGTPKEELEEVVLDVMARNGLSVKSLRNLATIEQKMGEPAIRAFSEKYGVPVSYYSAEELSGVTGVPNPSDKVMEAMGVAGVAEPSAMISAACQTLLQEKVKRGNVTVAVGRVNFS